MGILGHVLWSQEPLYRQQYIEGFLKKALDKPPRGQEPLLSPLPGGSSIIDAEIYGEAGTLSQSLVFAQLRVPRVLAIRTFHHRFNLRTHVQHPPIPINIHPQGSQSRTGYWETLSKRKHDETPPVSPRTYLL